MFAASKSGSVSEPTDSKFNYVTMLLHGNGTNGAQNNTFVDSSTNNFTITRNGNTTQGTFSPYGSNWSNYFDGTGDYLTAPNSTAFDLSTSNFTIEGFFYPTVGSASQSIFAYASNAGASISDYAFQLLINSSNGINFRVVASGSSSFTTISTSNTFTLNSWNYVCVTRTGTSVSVYLNGTTTTGTIASTIRNNASSILTIGRDPDGTFAITGYLSNLRILKGTAVTPSTPTTPLTAVTNTSLLTCQSNRFIDNSTNNFTITKNGDTSVQRFSPFNPTTAYSTSVIGGSGYFDGSGDYLNTPTSGQFAPTGDFTVSFWYYPTTLNTYNTVIGNYTSTASTDWFIEFTSNGSVNVYTNGSTVRITGGAGTIKSGQWSFVTLSRSGTTITFRINGTSIGTYTQSGTFGSATKTIYIGQYFTGSEYITGYLSDVRLLDGSEVTTIPTTPLTSVSGTNLLLNFTNAGILDNSMMNDLETVGNAQISTSVKKYGTGSLAFDGTGDYLSAASTPNLQFGTGDFTIEMWVYANSLTNSPILFDKTAGNLNDAGWFVELTSGGVYFGFGTTGGTPYILFNSASITTSIWFHLAVTRVGSTLTCFVNGTKLTPQTLTNANLAHDNTSALWIGNWKGGSGFDYNGYIDDLRITKGYARYTSNFTVPTAAFADKG